MYPILIIVHVIICAGLILVVLMQSAKGDGLAGMFGGGAGLSGAVFGGRGAATFLSKSTSVLAAAFIISSIVLTLASRGTISGGVGAGESAVERVINEQQRQMPATTAPTQGTQDPAQQQALPQSGDQGSEGGTQLPSGSDDAGNAGGGN